MVEEGSFQIPPENTDPFLRQAEVFIPVYAHFLDNPPMSLNPAEKQSMVGLGNGIARLRWAARVGFESVATEAGMDSSMLLLLEGGLTGAETVTMGTLADLIKAIDLHLPNSLTPENVAVRNLFRTDVPSLLRDVPIGEIVRLSMGLKGVIDVMSAA